jgi:AraC-like DNA-binding protein
MTNPAMALKEPTRHGTLTLPVAWYGHARRSWDGFFFFPHWHDELELFTVEKGQIELIINGHAWVMAAGSTALIPARVIHAAHVVPASPVAAQFSAIVFAPRLIASETNDAVQAVLTKTRTVATVTPGMVNQAALAPLLDQFATVYAATAPERPLLLKGLLLLILAQLLTNPIPDPWRTAQARLREQRQKQILTYLNARFAEPLTVPGLAAVINLSPEQFTRFFKAAFHRTPMAFLLAFRLQQAALLLRQTAASITDIAFQVGFQSANYFAAQFKRHYGLSPTAFRKMTE